jgi:hypothetical protein
VTPGSAPAPVRFDELPGGGATALMGSLGAPDLAAAGYVEQELRVTAWARPYRSAHPTWPPDGRFELVAGDPAPVVTRVVVRRPADARDASGTVVLEWLNVSSGADAAPGYGFFGSEVVRRGHVWVGLSAQKAGIESAPALVQIEGGIELVGVRQADPERYGSLHHPGDSHAYDLFTAVARALRDPAQPGNPLGDLAVHRILATGESQSAYALTTYVDGVQLVERAIDGFLVHSRGGPAAPLDGPDGRIDLDAGRHDPAVAIRDDLDVPVIVIETETDLLGHLRYLPARQPDADRFRLWEVAGAAHADRSLVGDFEEVLGCPGPVNRGQQRFVVRAALRWLDRWVRDPADRPPTAPRLEIEVDASTGTGSFGVDEVGNVRGGVRTPCVEAPAERLSGLAAPGANRACTLFGQTLPIPDEALRRRYPSVGAYLARYAAATDDAIAAGFVLPEDRDEVLADARAEVIARALA